MSGSHDLMEGRRSSRAADPRGLLCPVAIPNSIVLAVAFVTLLAGQEGATQGLQLSHERYDAVRDCFRIWLPKMAKGVPDCLGEIGMRVVREQGGIIRIEGRGRKGERNGSFRFREEGRPLILLAPHGVSDLRTGSIGLKLFSATKARVYLRSSVHRNGPLGAAKDGGKKEEGYDLAHLRYSVFQALLEAGVATWPRPAVVELHGFRGRSRSAKEIIVSSGDAGSLPEGLVARLRALLGKGSVGVYGDDAGTLGGTTNEQAHLMERIAPGRFVHLEMSPKLRRRLDRDDPFLRRFAVALMGDAPES